MPNLAKWKMDNYVAVGKTFKYEIANKLDSKNLLKIMGKVKTSSIDYEIFGGSSFPELPVYTGTLTKIDPRRGFKTVISPYERMGGYDIHYKQWKNDKVGELHKCASQLAEAGANSQYLAALDLFASAFNSSVLGGDGKAWAATDHPNASKSDSGRSYVADTESGTYSNLLTSALSVQGLDAAMVAGSKFMTPTGMPYLGEYDLVLVSPDLVPTARKLLGDDKRLMPTKDPESAENAASSIYGLKWMAIGGGAGASARGFTGKQWALCDSKRMKETVLIIETTAPEVQRGNPENPYIDNYIAYADYDMGYGDGRAIIFSNPS